MNKFDTWDNLKTPMERDCFNCGNYVRNLSLEKEDSRACLAFNYDEYLEPCRNGHDVRWKFLKDNK